MEEATGADLAEVKALISEFRHDFATERCRGGRLLRVEVSTETKNSRARKFYERCGLTEVGVFIKKYRQLSGDHSPEDGVFTGRNFV